MESSIYGIRGTFVKVLAGTNICDAIKDAIKLAKSSDSEIVFNFNGVLIQVDKNIDIEDAYKQYSCVFKHDTKKELRSLTQKINNIVDKL